jgi:nitrogen fixation/metabolism regulation signal transduction histidine kinase
MTSLSGILAQSNRLLQQSLTFSVRATSTQSRNKRSEYTATVEDGALLSAHRRAVWMDVSCKL